MLRDQTYEFFSSFGGRQVAGSVVKVLILFLLLHKHAILFQHGIPTHNTKRNFDKN